MFNCALRPVLNFLYAIAVSRKTVKIRINTTLLVLMNKKKKRNINTCLCCIYSNYESDALPTELSRLMMFRFYIEWVCATSGFRSRGLF